MSDRVVRTEKIGYFQRLRNSIGGIVFGIVLFLASFAVLFWNEGRVDLSRVAKTSTEIAATGSPTASVGDFVSVTGNITSPEQLGDSPYLAPGNYISLSRTAEMFAWDENSSTETKKNTGGSETKTTTYTYVKEWTSNPDDSSSFENPNGHFNPEKSIDSTKLNVSKANIGDYQLDMNSLSLRLPNAVDLSPETVAPEYKNKLSGGFIHIGKGTPAQPEIGDMRLSYKALNKDVLSTVFGAFSAPNQLSTYIAKKFKGISVYRLLPGNRVEAIATLKSEHKIMTWILRFVGFGMMWFGMNLVIEPLGVLLDFSPLLAIWPAQHQDLSPSYLRLFFQPSPS